VENPPLDALKHRVRRKEIQADEALKTWVKFDLGFLVSRVLTLRSRPMYVSELL
jgi:hypothetical protein